MTMPRKSSIGAELFRKVEFLIEILKISKNLGKLKKCSRGALLLYELSEREPGGRFTARCHNTEAVAKPARLGPAQNGTPM